MGHLASIFGTYRAWAAAGLVVLALALPAPAFAAFPPKTIQLAEILGAVHHLRDVCGANEGQLWRNKMIEMIAVLQPKEADRQRLVKHFNDSFYRYRNAYPRCTATAATQSDKLMQDGQRIAEELAASGFGR